MFLPGRVFGTAMVVRSVVLWTGIRAAALGLGSPPTIGPHSVLVLFLVTFLSGHDNRILSERALLSNIGVSAGMLRIFSLVPAVLAEVALHLVSIL